MQLPPLYCFFIFFIYSIILRRITFVISKFFLEIFYSDKLNERLLNTRIKLNNLFGNQPPILKTTNVRRTRHAGYCWRSKDEFTRYILHWTTSHRRAKRGRPDKTYIQQLWADTWCNLEDSPGAKDKRDGSRERVWEIRAGSSTWWRWYYFQWTLFSNL